MTKRETWVAFLALHMWTSKLDKMQTSMFQIETLTSSRITVQGTQVRLRSLLVRLRCPAIHGGVIWNRPVAVVVRTLDGDESILPIPDVTRTALLALAGLCFAGVFIFKFLRRKMANS